MRRQSQNEFLRSVGLTSTGRNLMDEIIEAHPIRKRVRPSGLVIGRWSDGSDYVIRDEVRWRSNIHMIGPSGFAKSYAMYSLICQDILSGRGVCVIDPHSELYFMLLNFLVQQQIDPSRVVIVNPLLQDWTLKLNPLQSFDGFGSGGALTSESLIHAAGSMDYEHQMRLRQYLPAACRLLEEARHPLALLPWFCATHPAGERYRAELSRQSHERISRLTWQQFLYLTKSQQSGHVESTKNQAMSIADEPRIHRMMTYAAGNLDWREVMDRGAIVLCNLGDIGGRSVPLEARRLIGTLVTHGIGRAAKRRPNGREQPFCVYCDEFGEYMSDKSARALDGLRRFGVYSTLAHQRLEEMRETCKRTTDAIMDDCKIKLVFGGLNRPAAEELAKELFTGYVDGNEVKYEQNTRAFRPVVEWMNLISHTQGRSHTVVDGNTETTSETTGVSVTYGPGGILFPDRISTTESSSFQEALTQSSSWAETISWSTTTSRVPVTTFDEFFQDPGRQFVPLEEQWEKKYALLMNLAARSVVVKQFADPPAVVPTLDVRVRIASQQKLAEFEQTVCQRCPYIVPAEQAEQKLDRLLIAHGFHHSQLNDSPVAERQSNEAALPTSTTNEALNQKGKTVLPESKKSLPEIARLTLTDQILAACRLLDYLLAYSGHDSVWTDGKSMMLSDKVTYFASIFSTVNLSDLYAAIGCRNALEHTDDPKNAAVPEHRKRKAQASLLFAIEDVLEHGDVPTDIVAAVRGR